MEASQDVSEPETQFVPQEDDEDNLWQVIAIVDEDKKMYKVKWAGTDSNGNPWPLDWVPKHDCTPDLVVEWKKKKARRRSSVASRSDNQTYKPHKRASSKGSSASKASPAKSTSTIRSNKRSSASSTPRPTNTKKSVIRNDDVWDDPPKAGPSKSKGKRKLSSITPSDDEDDALNGDATRPASRPSKKRKTVTEPEESEIEEMSADDTVQKTSVRNGKLPVKKHRVSERELDEDEEAEMVQTGKKKAQTKPKPVPVKAGSSSANSRRPSKFIQVESESEEERRKVEKQKTKSKEKEKEGTHKSTAGNSSSSSKSKSKPSGSGSGSRTSNNTKSTSSTSRSRSPSIVQNLDNYPTDLDFDDGFDGAPQPEPEPEPQQVVSKPKRDPLFIPESEPELEPESVPLPPSPSPPPPEPKPKSKPRPNGSTVKPVSKPRPRPIPRSESMSESDSKPKPRPIHKPVKLIARKNPSQSTGSEDEEEEEEQEQEPVEELEEGEEEEEEEHDSGDEEIPLPAPARVAGTTTNGEEADMDMDTDIQPAVSDEELVPLTQSPEPKVQGVKKRRKVLEEEEGEKGEEESDTQGRPGEQEAEEDEEEEERDQDQENDQRSSPPEQLSPDSDAPSDKAKKPAPRKAYRRKTTPEEEIDRSQLPADSEQGVDVPQVNRRDVETRQPQRASKTPDAGASTTPQPTSKPATRPFPTLSKKSANPVPPSQKSALPKEPSNPAISKPQPGAGLNGRDIPRVEPMKRELHKVIAPINLPPASTNVANSSGSNAKDIPRVEPIRRELPKVIAPITLPPASTPVAPKPPCAPNLSPAALKRLAEFDAFLATLPPDPIPSLSLPPPVNGANTDEPAEQHPESPVETRPDDNAQSQSRSRSASRSRSHSPRPPVDKPVPETEPDDSSSSHPSRPEIEMPFAPVPRSLKRPSIISQMKRRSPLKASHLAPIRPMTPSRMKQMFASIGRNLSQEEHLSTIQYFDDSSTTAEPSASQIEQFSSPEKQSAPPSQPQPFHKGGLSSLGLEMKGKKRANSTTTITEEQEQRMQELDVRKKGEALAEKHRQRELLERNGGEVPKKRRIEDIIQVQERAMSAPLPLPPPPEKEKHVGFAIATPPPDDVPIEASQESEKREHHAFSQPTQAQQESQESNGTAGAHIDSSQQMDVDEYDVGLQYPSGDDASPAVIHESSAIPPTQDEMEIPATASDRHDTLPPSSHPVDATAHQETADLVTAMRLLNEKSEEISRLEAVATEERTKSQTLTLELDSFQRQMEELRAANETLTAALAAATLAKETAEKDKLSAEKDKEIFREEYARASAFVSSVRDENKELEKRAQIAEGQAKEGVALIKATFERRQKDLEVDLEQWRRLAAFAIEKDMRTNDEIRRRAAEEPELRRKNEELKAELENANLQLDEQDAQIATLERQLEEVRAAEALKSQTHTGIEINGEDTQMSIQADVQRHERPGREYGDDALIYRCEWVSAGNVPCSSAFPTPANLEDHAINHCA
ncbi:hypothetical protein VKT23_016036 [Stygiomarasmius scandens]|uniref:Chromo domain-containing protein n=1 Tax=Marasmiellus scandens TaxID=2682957 RepID=A0ABR1J0Q7_9AGAR